MNLSELDALWWDLYKDVHGFRPRSIDTTNWTETDYNKEIDYLNTRLGFIIEEDKRREEKAILDFENRIASLMQYGARDRAMALRWLNEAYETNGRWDFLEYNLGLPFGYFSERGDVV